MAPLDSWAVDSHYLQQFTPPRQLAPWTVATKDIRANPLNDSNPWGKQAGWEYPRQRPYMFSCMAHEKLRVYQNHTWFNFQNLCQCWVQLNSHVTPIQLGEVWRSFLKQMSIHPRTDQKLSSFPISSHKQPRQFYAVIHVGPVLPSAFSHVDPILTFWGLHGPRPKALALVSCHSPQ